jgi:alkylation response protein AidB-like acyl-CoA dehydrogenase
MQVLDAGRIGIAALAVGLAQGRTSGAQLRARASGVWKADQRFQGDSIGSSRTPRRAIEAARLLISRRVPETAGQRTTLESSIAKLRERTAVRVADDCVQIHGGAASKDYPAEKWLPRRETDDHWRGDELRSSG